MKSNAEFEQSMIEKCSRPKELLLILYRCTGNINHQNGSYGEKPDKPVAIAPEVAGHAKPVLCDLLAFFISCFCFGSLWVMSSYSLCFIMLYYIKFSIIVLFNFDTTALNHI